MCGIVGIWNAGLEHTLLLMRDTLTHRGPDVAGIYHDDKFNLILGHRRLRIIDISEDSDQPFLSRDGRYALVYNGEVYNFKELRRELESYGEKFYTKGDTEVVLSALMHWGSSALDKFEGMFALALWDSEEKSLFLARDRFGVKPLLYWQSGYSFAFASEIKALRVNKIIPLDPDINSLADFLEMGYIPAPKSAYKNIFKLMPGQMMWVRDGGRELSFKQWWEPTQYFLKKTDVSETELLEELHDRLTTAFDRRMIADVPVGVFLSGGVDSSAVVAILSQHHNQINTFTIGFPERDFDEARYAQRISNIFGTNHTELYCEPNDVRTAIEEIFNTFDEPFGDPSSIPTMLVSKLAREKVTVSLSAEGGDELFAGYSRYPLALRWLKQPGFMRKAVSILPEGLISKLLAIKGIPDPCTKAAKTRWLSNAKSPSSLYRAITRYYSDDEIERILGVKTEKRKYQISDLPSDLPVIDFLRLADINMYLSNDILVKTDRASMSVSLESREPFLDNGLFKFAANLPDKWLIRNGMGKYLLRKLLQRYIPEELLNRPKMGFGVPLIKWFAEDLSGLVNEVLNPDSLREVEFLNCNEILKILPEKFDSKLAANKVWLMMMLVKW